jgi:hypothetical protein
MREREVEQEPISAYEAAKEFAGCVDGGSGDLATNKKLFKVVDYDCSQNLL